jgi:hypothetical protein
MNMDDLVNALNQSNAAPKAKDEAKGGDPMGDLLGALGSSQPQSGGELDLGSLLGGGAPVQGGGQPDLGSLLGMLGGGGGQQGGDPMMGLLGGLLGGGSATGGMGGSPFDALVGPLVEKIGISPQIASMVVMFLANALLSGKAGSRSGAVDTNAAADLSDVVSMLNSGQADSQALHGNQLVRDLSQQTGLDEQTAARSIGALADMLGGQQGLEGLLGK